MDSLLGTGTASNGLMLRVAFLTSIALLASCGVDFGTSGDFLCEGCNAKKSEPILLVHGFSVDASVWDDVIDTMEAEGFLVFAPELPSFESIDARARDLGQAIDDALLVAEYSGLSTTGKVHLVGYSMGGLDSRYAISTLGYGDRVASLTTIGTPHRGSAIADFFLGLSDTVTGSYTTEQIVNSASAYFGVIDISDEKTRRALLDLSTSKAVDFNKKNPDDARVNYESWAGLSNPFGFVRKADAEECDRGDKPLTSVRHNMPYAKVPLAYLTGGVLEQAASDGVVTVPSATWGNFRGCLLGTHETLAESSNLFDAVNFYRELARSLTDPAPELVRD